MQGGKFNRRAWAKRATVVWAVSFLLLEVVFGLAVQGPLDYIRNPDYQSRLSQLRGKTNEIEDRRLVLILGSSRVQQGVRPELINCDRHLPFVYNFARGGHGPRHHCLTLKRLLRDGIRPDGVILEMAPLQLKEPLDPVDQTNLLNHDYTDLRESLPFREQPDRARDEWLRAQVLLPCFSYRYHLMAQVPLDWNPPSFASGRGTSQDPYGWQSNYRKRAQLPTAQETRSLLTPYLANWQLHPLNRKAIEEIANVCWREHIALTFLLMPEGPVYRSCYSAESETNLREFQQWLENLHVVKVVNAREWLDDEDFYTDSHHIESESAPIFTRMFVERVLPALHTAPDRTSVLRR